MHLVVYYYTIGLGRYACVLKTPAPYMQVTYVCKVNMCIERNLCNTCHFNLTLHFKKMVTAHGTSAK